MKSPAEAGAVRVGTTKGALNAKKAMNDTSRRMAGPFCDLRNQITLAIQMSAKTISGGMIPANTLMSATTITAAIALHLSKLTQLMPRSAWLPEATSSV